MLNRIAGVITLLAALTTGNLFAGTLTNYTVGDVLICFRISGNDNLVVDAGPISYFTNLSANQTVQITYYTGSQLATVHTNALIWGAYSWFDDSVTPANIQWTMFLTKARTSLNTQSTPWAASSAAAQFYPISDMQTIPVGALDQRNYNTKLSTKYAIVEETGITYNNGFSYADAIYSSAYPNFNGDLNGFPENTTVTNFTALGTVQRSDFYWVPPTDSGNQVKYLGYFQLNTNGYMSYVAYPTVTVAPTVTTTTATGAANNFATLNGTVNPNGQSSTAFFVYGLTSSYGSTNAISGALTGSSTLAVSTNLTGLSWGQTYHFRLAAYNTIGTNYGSDLTFATAALPTPAFTSYSRSVTNDLLSFQTYSGATYTVLGTNVLSGSYSNWPVLFTLAGDGLVHTITNKAALTNMFYIIGAQ